ncbi:MAG: DUF2382 domain-containing protein [Nocardioidaceae bacterium]
MLDESQIAQISGTTVYGSDGNKIGKAGEVYLDDQTGRPEWVTVNTGLFGTSESFVPLSDASLSGEGLSVPYDKDTVKNAPNLASDGHLSPDDERNLYTYYNVGYDEGAASGSNDTVGTTTETTTTTRGDDDAMTLSQERMEVGTQSQEAGRARLRKYVDTENVTQTVPVTKERAVLEREPITDANVGDATSGPDFTESEAEVVLHEERPVTEKVAEPVERVRLGTEQVQTEETVTGEVRKERVEVDGDVSDTDRS